MTHCRPRVTPGLLPVLADALGAIALMTVDFPQLGMPNTIARTGLGRRFLALSFSMIGREAVSMAIIISRSPCLRAALTAAGIYPIFL